MSQPLVQLRRPSTSFAMPFRHRDVGGKVLVTNTEGDFLLLTPEEFGHFAAGGHREGDAHARAPLRGATSSGPRWTRGG